MQILVTILFFIHTNIGLAWGSGTPGSGASKGSATVMPIGGSLQNPLAVQSQSIAALESLMAPMKNKELTFKEYASAVRNSPYYNPDIARDFKALAEKFPTGKLPKVDFVTSKYPNSENKKIDRIEFTWAASGGGTNGFELIPVNDKKKLHTGVFTVTPKRDGTAIAPPMDLSVSGCKDLDKCIGDFMRRANESHSLGYRPPSTAKASSNGSANTADVATRGASVRRTTGADTAARSADGSVGLTMVGRPVVPSYSPQVYKPIPEATVTGSRRGIAETAAATDLNGKVPVLGVLVQTRNINQKPAVTDPEDQKGVGVKTGGNVRLGSGLSPDSGAKGIKPQKEGPLQGGPIVKGYRINDGVEQRPISEGEVRTLNTQSASVGAGTTNAAVANPNGSEARIAQGPQTAALARLAGARVKAPESSETGTATVEGTQISSGPRTGLAAAQRGGLVAGVQIPNAGILATGAKAQAADSKGSAGAESISGADSAATTTNNGNGGLITDAVTATGTGPAAIGGSSSGMGDSRRELSPIEKSAQTAGSMIHLNGSTGSRETAPAGSSASAPVGVGAGASAAAGSGAADRGAAAAKSQAEAEDAEEGATAVLPAAAISTKSAILGGVTVKPPLKMCVVGGYFDRDCNLLNLESLGQDHYLKAGFSREGSRLVFTCNSSLFPLNTTIEITKDIPNPTSPTTMANTLLPMCIEKSKRSSNWEQFFARPSVNSTKEFGYDRLASLSEFSNKCAEINTDASSADQKITEFFDENSKGREINRMSCEALREYIDQVIPQQCNKAYPNNSICNWDDYNNYGKKPAPVQPKPEPPKSTGFTFGGMWNSFVNSSFFLPVTIGAAFLGTYYLMSRVLWPGTTNGGQVGGNPVTSSPYIIPTTNPAIRGVY